MQYSRPELTRYGSVKQLTSSVVQMSDFASMETCESLGGDAWTGPNAQIFVPAHLPHGWLAQNYPTYDWRCTQE